MNEKRIARHLALSLEKKGLKDNNDPKMYQLQEMAEKISQAPDVTPHKLIHRAAKVQLLNSLPSRPQVVTKSAFVRFKHRIIQPTRYRRFTMSWILIVATVLSLFGGAGAVYASDRAVPGQALYPVKTLVEDVRLLMANDEADVDLLLGFLDERLSEMGILLEQDDLQNLLTAFSGYENRARQLQQLMTRVQPQEPVQGQALESMLQSRLQQQAQLLQGVAAMAGDQVQIRERIQLFLETTEQLRSRDMKQTEEVENASAVPENGQPADKAGQPEEKGEPQGAAHGQENQQTQWQTSLEAHYVDADGQYVLTFRVHAALMGNTYMKVNGVEFACATTDAAQGLLTCKGPAPQGEELSVELFDRQSGQMIYAGILRMNRYGQDGETGGMGSGNGKNK